MNVQSLVYALLVEHASRSTPDQGDDEQYRQGYWDAIVHTMQLANGISEEEATQRVHDQYTAICDATK